MEPRLVTDLIEVLTNGRMNLQKIMNNDKLDKREISKAHWYYTTYGKDIERLTSMVRTRNETIWMH